MRGLTCALNGAPLQKRAKGAPLRWHLIGHSHRASWPRGRMSALSDDVEVLDPRRDVAVLRFFGVQLDVEAQVVDAVGVPQRVLVADLARLEQIEQRLVEGLHAQLAGLL